MASAAIRNTGQALPSLGGSHAPALAKAGDRLWMVLHGGSTAPAGVRLLYSDDDGATWTDHAEVNAGTGALASSLCAYQDAADAWHLAIVTAGGNTSSAPLAFRALHTNVDAGVPGALTAAVNIDGENGGTNLGAQWPMILHTPTAANPRLWVVYMGRASSSTIQTRAAFVAEGTAADTGANWSRSGFLGLAGSSDSLQQHAGTGRFWTDESDAEVLTIAFLDRSTSPSRWAAVNVDPAAAVPAPGSAVTLYQGNSADQGATGGHIALADKPGELLAAFYAHTDASIRVARSTDGATWTVPTGWGPWTGSWPALVRLDGNYALAYSPNATFATAAALELRIIDGDTLTMGAASALTDTAGVSPELVPIPVGEVLRSVYVAGSTVRTDAQVVEFGETAPAEDPAPAAVADLRAEAVASGRIDLTWTNPVDPYLAEYSVRRSGVAAPATTADGTEVVGWTAAVEGASVTRSDTGLVDGAEQFYSVFTRNAAALAGDPASVRAVPRAPLERTSPANGATVDADPFLEWDVTAANVDPERATVHFRLELGTGDPADGVVVTDARTARDGGDGFEWDDAGVWTALPDAGLPLAELPTSVRYLAAEAGGDGDYWWTVRATHGVG